MSDAASKSVVWAIVPLKSFVDAKQRLRDVLDSAQRAQLMLAMARDVLNALSSASGIEGTLIVSRAAEAASLAAEFGAEVLRESPNADLSGAVFEACAHLEDHKRATTALVVHGDVPLLEPADLTDLIAAHRDITLVPASDRDGTNCVVVSPPTRLGFRFGASSFPLHVAAARALGVEPRVVANLHLALDIDTPADLRALIERIGASNTRTFLDGSGIASRIGHPHNSPSTRAQT